MITFIIFIALFTVIYGRLFCGWVCPQTVFMEMVFRKIEWWIEGSPNQQKKNRSEEHTSELQSQSNIVCRLLLEKKNKIVSTSLWSFVPQMQLTELDYRWARLWHSRMMRRLGRYSIIADSDLWSVVHALSSAVSP